MSHLLPWKPKAALRPLPSSAAVSLSQAAPASWHQWPWPSSLVSDNGNVVPRGLVALCGTRTVSLAGWWLVAASRAQQREYGDRGRMGTEGGNCGQEASRGAEEGVQGQGLLLSPVLVPRPSLSLHPSQGVSLGDTVTQRCHLP